MATPSHHPMLESPTQGEHRSLQVPRSRLVQPLPGGAPDLHWDLAQVAVPVLDHMRVLRAVERWQGPGIVPETLTFLCRVNGRCDHIAAQV